MPVNLRVCVLRSHRDSWVLWIQHDGMDWGVTIHFSIEIQLVLAIREQERGERVIESSVAQRGQWSGHTERQKCSHRPNPQLLIASLYCKGSYFFPPEWRIADQYHYSTLCKYAYALQTGPEKHMVADLNALLLKDCILCIVYRFWYVHHFLQCAYASTDTIQYPIMQCVRLVHFKCDT